MKKEPRFLLQLSKEDFAILKALQARLTCSRADALRWALRWYALGGPWRHPDERLLAPLEGRASGLQVGPLERQVS